MSNANDHVGIATPYTAVYVIFRKAGKIAFLLRTNTGWMNNHYGLPAGRVEEGESLAAAAIREAKEEVGVDIQKSDLKQLLTVHRNHTDSLWVDIFFEAQKWEGELHNAEPDIHGELTWFDTAELPDNLVPGIRYCVEKIEAGESYGELGWDGSDIAT